MICGGVCKQRYWGCGGLSKRRRSELGENGGCGPDYGRHYVRIQRGETPACWPVDFGGVKGGRIDSDSVRAGNVLGWGGGHPYRKGEVDCIED